MDFKALEHEVLSLPPSDRAKLAHELLESLDSFSESDLESMWLDEAAHRAQQLDQGTELLIPGDIVSRKAHSLLR